MSETQTPSITFREVGCNPPEDGNRVQHVDMSKTGLFQRIGKAVFRPDGKAAAARQPVPRLSAEQELAELKPRLVHYEAQYAAALACAEAGNSAPIAGGNILRLKQRLVESLNAGRDVASDPSVDSQLLVSILNDCQGGGLIPATRDRIFLLEQQQAVGTFETGNAEKKKKALARLAKAAIELAAAYEAAVPFYRAPLGPCLRGFPTDILRNVWKRVKHLKCKTPDDLV